MNYWSSVINAVDLVKFSGQSAQIFGWQNPKTISTLHLNYSPHKNTFVGNYYNEIKIKMNSKKRNKHPQIFSINYANFISELGPNQY